ncbi:MAG: DNA-directed RNA polymerase subunit omega [Candidatus Sumerlaeota bacterium]
MEHDVSSYVKESKGKFLLVNSLSKRVRDLQSGYKPLVPASGKDFEDIAIEEFREGKIQVETRDWKNEFRQ